MLCVRDAGTFVDGFILSHEDAAVRVQGLVRQVFARRRHELKMSVAVVATYQHRKILLGHNLAHVGRDIVDGKADPPRIRAIGSGRVQHPAVMKRCLARRQQIRYRVLIADLNIGRLASGQSVLLAKVSM